MARHASARRQEKPRGIWRLLLVLWICFIWVHSLIPGPVSSDESMLFVRLAAPLFRLVGISDLDLLHLIVRKGAHFSEYLVLGVLSVVALRPRLAVPLFPTVLTALVWVAVPSIDEFIQLHVPGRAGAVTDVLIDMAGFAVGCAVALVVRHIADSRRRAREERERRARQERAARYVRKARKASRERAAQRQQQTVPQISRPKHALGAPQVRRGRHERIQSEPDENRQRFESRTRR